MPVQHEKDMDPTLLAHFREHVGTKEPQRRDGFDDAGLRYPIEWLRELGISLVLLPLEWQARYVDEVTYFATSPVVRHEAGEVDAFFESQWQKANIFPIEEMNATSIGNLAFMALYAPNSELREEHREKALAILNRIHDYVVERVKQQQGS